MIRHPFFGIVVPKAGDARDPNLSHDDVSPAASATQRRSFLGQLAGAAVGAAALLTGRTTRGQQASLAVETPSTASQTQSSGGIYTTQAVGEEGGYYPRPPQPPSYPGYPPPGMVTTYAIGEEGGIYRPRYPVYPSYPPPGTVTTYALGEEGSYGGGYYYPPRHTYRPGYYYYRY